MSALLKSDHTEFWKFKLLGVHMKTRSSRLIQAAAGIGFFLAASVLHAQGKPSGEEVCSAFDTFPVENEPPKLSVACGTYGVTLGTFDRYELVQFPDFDAAVVITSLEGAQRVFLLIKNPDESVALEEVTSAITLEMGRGVQSSIVGARLDLGSATLGRMTAADPSAEAKGLPPATIDIAAIISHSRAMRGQIKAEVAP
jgi:hypothetical protein